MVVSTVLPSRARSLTVPITSSEVAESRPEVGSSKNKTRGLFSKPRAMEIRLASPPLTPLVIAPPILVSLLFVSPI